MLARILGGVGRSMMTVGTLILLFVAYQLWGTGLQEARSQEGLGDEFAQILDQADEVATTTAPALTAPATTAPATTSTTAVTAPIEVVPTAAAPRLPLPGYGDPVARIEIPRIGITRTVVEGVTIPQLARGPGHYPESPLPGQAGNVSIAGHRTTYGQPFHNVDKLSPGDQILTTTVQGDFVYEVERLEIVEPDDVAILEDKGDNRLTLIACHPKYSLEQRIIVHALLRGAAAPEIAGQEQARAQVAEDGGSGDELAAGETVQPSIDGAGLSGASTSRWPAVLWGLACAAIWLVTWLVQTVIRRRTRARASRPNRRQRLVAWTPYSIGLPVFLVALYVFFENFQRLLPGNY